MEKRQAREGAARADLVKTYLDRGNESTIPAEKSCF
jgi:hypothetical protein